MRFLLAAGAIFGAALAAAYATMPKHDPVSTLPPPPPDNGPDLNAKIAQLAQAIAKAEGFGAAGKIPTLAHNPGDLVEGDAGSGTLGAEKITVYPDDATGWSKLDHQVFLMLTETSRVYSLSMTFFGVAQKWTTTDPDAWASTVSGAVGLTPANTLADFLAK